MLKRDLSNEAKMFIRILEGLTERDTIILIERFSRDKSLKKVAKQLKVTDSAIRETENKLIKLIDNVFNVIP